MSDRGRIGFTGTRAGMTPNQLRWLWDTLALWQAPASVEFHHGDCIGADEEAHAIAAWFGYHIVAHPPADPGQRAFCQCDEILGEREYLARNGDIVNDTDGLIAAPRGLTEVRRGSGTWATIRRARKASRPTLILEP